MVPQIPAMITIEATTKNIGAFYLEADRDRFVQL